METATQYIKMNDFKIMTFFKKNTWQLNVLISNINCPKLKVLNSNPRLLSYFSYYFVHSPPPASHNYLSKSCMSCLFDEQHRKKSIVFITITKTISKNERKQDIKIQPNRIQ